MEPDERIRRIGQNVPHQPEADWAGRIIPSRGEIERAIYREPPKLSNKKRRRLERQSGGNPERG